MEGAILVMFNHGILTGALFLLVGFLYERTHTRQIADMGLLAKPLPIRPASRCSSLGRWACPA